MLPPGVPQLDAACSAEEFAEAFARSRLVVIRGVARTSAAATSRVLHALRAAHREKPAPLEATHTLESGALDEPTARKRARRTSAMGETLGAALAPTSAGSAWYASFIVQELPAAAHARVVKALPAEAPPCFPAHLRRVAAGQPIWVFIGANRSSRPLQGRPEHTDALLHDGTWHLQLSGSKVWRVRATEELRAAVRGRPALPKRTFEIVCEAGDALVIDTRLWWHSTELPPGADLSISYALDTNFAPGSAAARPSPPDAGGARDAARPSRPASAAAGEARAPAKRARGASSARSAATADPPSRAGASGMTNVDGLFASCPVRAGTPILTQDEMPACELPTSTDEFNCEVCEDEESGTLVLVATRDLASGEFFVCREDEDEDEEDDDDDDEADGDGSSNGSRR